ncbi:MAG: ribonuclease R [Deltaproteobacteria bacterium]|nr:ribonuclease R [Deltaproteobacteria bacterium]
MSRSRKHGKKGRPRQEELLKAFQRVDKPLKLQELFSLLGISKTQREWVEEMVESLVSQGRLIRMGRAFGLVKKMPMQMGTLEIQRSGVGFVIPEDKRHRDIFISRSALGGAWHGDKVLVTVLPRRRGKNPEGRIVRVVERFHSRIAVKIIRQLGHGTFFSRPVDPKLGFNVIIDQTGAVGQPSLADIVLVRPEAEIDGGTWSARLEEILGSEEDVRVQETLVKTGFAIPTTFSEGVLSEAGLLPETPQEKDLIGRQDLTKVSLVTIDGANARDFDDAVCVSRENSGWRLWVAIADVSHYVAPGSALDREAEERGNSYYFPASVEPMLPEKLSNGLCSLVPAQPRLAMVAEILFSFQGLPIEERFYPALIRSRARLTYDQVKRAILDSDQGEQERLEVHLPMLYQAEALARELLARREERGSLDFDLPEPEILIDICDHAKDVRPRPRHFGHQIIEEFMLAANEAVARFLEQREARFLFRNHPSPDLEKLESLFKLLRFTSIGSSLPEKRDAKGLQTLFSAAKGTEMEFLVNRLALRSMMQAGYSPVNEGHFGLASDCYCHFTSPIRRYADLVVHRALKAALSEEPPRTAGEKRLKNTAEHINAMERKAVEAEREIVKRLTILFLREKVGETYSGIISSLTDFGFWVELKEVMAEGMVRLSTLTDDYYIFLDKRHELLGERTGRSLRLGQEVRVRLVSADLSRLEVNLELEGS